MNLNRHYSGADRNPVDSKKFCETRQNQGFAHFAGCIFSLDSGLRRNDGASQ